MREQKMPALPELGIDTAAHYGPRIRGYTVEQAERIRAEAYEAGRQQERERLEPLRVALDWMETHVRELCTMTGTPLPQASLDRTAAARRVAEGAGEPVAWRLQGGPWSDDVMWFNASVPICEALLKVDGVRVEYAYSGLTTPPSADALVEAIQTALVDHGDQKCAGCTAVDAALAKHKENTDDW